MPVSYCITLQYFHISHAVCFGSNGRLLRQCLYSSVSAPLPHIHESGVKVYLKLVVGSFFIKKEINPVSVNDQAVSMSSFPPSSLLIIYSSSISPSTSRLVFHSKHFKAFFAVTWDGLHVFSGEGCEIQTFASFKWAFIFIWKLSQSWRSFHKLTKSPFDNSHAISFQYFDTYQLIINTYIKSFHPRNWSFILD